MTKCPEYVNAFFGTPAVVAGFKLRPFCLGHAIILAKFNSPFVIERENEPVTLIDLLFAVAICVRTYEEAMEYIANPDFVKTDLENSKDILEKEYSESNPFDFKEEIKTMVDYITSNFQQPKFSIERESSSSSGINWIQNLLIVAVSKLGYTHDQALNAPITRLNYDAAWIGECNGAIRVLTEEEIELIAEAEKIEKEKEATKV